MIVIELEEKKYGKAMEAVSKIKEFAECLSDMFEENSMGKSIAYRKNMGYRGGMGHRGYDDYHKDEKEYEDYGKMYRGDYGERYM